MGWFSLYSQWMKLLFTMWVTFHLFCFAVLHKNLKKLEVLPYAVTSLLVPAVVACIPLLTHSYGRSPDGTNCFMYAEDDIAFTERIAIWDGPAMFILLATSTAMVVMVIKLTGSVYLRSKYEPITDGDQFWKALNSFFHWLLFLYCFSSLKSLYSCFMYMQQQTPCHYKYQRMCFSPCGVRPLVELL